jgi:hypothetical protein
MKCEPPPQVEIKFDEVFSSKKWANFEWTNVDLRSDSRRNTVSPLTIGWLAIWRPTKCVSAFLYVARNLPFSWCRNPSGRLPPPGIRPTTNFPCLFGFGMRFGAFTGHALSAIKSLEICAEIGEFKIGKVKETSHFSRQVFTAGDRVQ